MKKRSDDDAELIKRLRAQLSALENECYQLKNMIEALPGDIYWKDINGRWLGVNSHGEQSLKRMGFIRNSEDVIGKTDYELFNKETADIYRKNDLEVIARKMEIAQEETVALINGKKMIQLSTKRPIWDKNGIITGIVGNTIDITYLKNIEQELKNSKEAAEAANQAKTEFLANMRHDVRTPLSGIVGFSEIIKSESNEPHIKEYAHNLIASSHALLDLMDEVLEAVRVSSGEIPMLKRKFNLVQTLEQVISLYSAKAHEKKLALSLSVDTKLPRYVLGDKIRVHRIALELISNALNFTEKGQVTLRVELAKQKNRELVIKIIVRDSGIGIPKEKQQEIYVQFKRLTPSYQGIYKGAGLGLYVVKQFIDELDGEIHVESEPSNGTIFTCLIPLKEPLLDDGSGIDNAAEFTLEKAPLMPLANPQDVAHSLSDRKSTSTVLVVEDNFIAQTVAKTLLGALDCQVDVVSNGVDALTRCQQKKYDLIFMDIGLGAGMDGYEVTHHIRNQSKDAPYIPIIALTAHAADESKQLCIEAGMDAVLTKPLTQAHAADILNTYIPKRHESSNAKPVITRYDLPDSDEELFQLSQFPIFDRDNALQNCGTQEMLNELLILVLQALPVDLEQMNNAFKHQDYSLVEKTAHKIKGGAVYVGTTRMKYACQYLERYWKTGAHELFVPLYYQAVTAIEETLIYIEGCLHR